MKISKGQLKRIIKEEKQRLLTEAPGIIGGVGFHSQQSPKTNVPHRTYNNGYRKPPGGLDAVDYGTGAPRSVCLHGQRREGCGSERSRQRPLQRRRLRQPQYLRRCLRTRRAHRHPRQRGVHRLPPAWMEGQGGAGRRPADADPQTNRRGFTGCRLLPLHQKRRQGL